MLLLYAKRKSFYCQQFPLGTIAVFNKAQQSDSRSCFLDECTQDVRQERVETTFTLICDVEPWFVLWVVAVEEESGLMGGAKERVGQHRATGPINHCARLQVPASHLQIVMNRLCGEVHKLQMDPLKEERKQTEWMCRFFYDFNRRLIQT